MVWWRRVLGIWFVGGWGWLLEAQANRGIWEWLSWEGLKVEAPWEGSCRDFCNGGHGIQFPQEWKGWKEAVVAEGGDL